MFVLTCAYGKVDYTLYRHCTVLLVQPVWQYDLRMSGEPVHLKLVVPKLWHPELFPPFFSCGAFAAVDTVIAVIELATR